MVAIHDSERPRPRDDAATLRSIAALATTLPRSSVRLHLGTRAYDAVRTLEALGAPRETTIYVFPDGQTHAIVSAEMQIDGLTVEAQYTRDATPEEVARTRDAGHEHLTTFRTSRGGA